MLPPFVVSFARFLFNDTATTEMYTLSLHDALPITPARRGLSDRGLLRHPEQPARSGTAVGYGPSRERRTGRHRSEEHTSELQSRVDLVCRLLLEKKKKPPHYLSARERDVQR